MDSANNSGSKQSSDEEYESRGESFTSFFNPSGAGGHFGSISDTTPATTISATSTSTIPSSFSSSSNQSLFGASHSQLLNQQPQFASSSSSTMPSQSAEGNPPRAGSNQHSDHHQSIGKNPKKRTRASRRAPTTVLTTDTTNFRQMVQEFTGFPAAPFSSSPYSRRLDLFSGGGGGVSGMRSGNLDALNPLYPLRPSAQKLQISPFLPQSSSSSSPSSL